jgi:hypothetical protein
MRCDQCGCFEYEHGPGERQPNHTFVEPMHGPQRVGGRYKCGYWQYEYTVLAIHGAQITCRQETAGAFPEQIGRVWSHMTAWDPRHDKVISQPANRSSRTPA